MIQVVVYDNDESKPEVLSKIDKYVDKLFVVRVGSDQRDVKAEDLKYVASLFAKSLEANNAIGDVSVLVTHYDLDVLEIIIKE